MRLGPGVCDPGRLWSAVEQADPGVLAFNGLATARAALGLSSRTRLAFGPLDAADRGRPLWVLPSTSGTAASTWDPQVWVDLGRQLPASPACWRASGMP